MDTLQKGTAAMILELASAMEDPASRKAFGARIKALRKQKKWTQKELATQLGLGFSHLNKYEGGQYAPPVEKVLRLAEIFGTTVDYLLTGRPSEDNPLQDLRLLERMQALQELAAEDRELAIQLIDALIVKNRAQQAVQPVGKRAS